MSRIGTPGNLPRALRTGGNIDTGEEGKNPHTEGRSVPCRANYWQLQLVAVEYCRTKTTPPRGFLFRSDNYITHCWQSVGIHFRTGNKRRKFLFRSDNYITHCGQSVGIHFRTGNKRRKFLFRSEESVPHRRHTAVVFSSEQARVPHREQAFAKSRKVSSFGNFFMRAGSFHSDEDFNPTPGASCHHAPEADCECICAAPKANCGNYISSRKFLFRSKPLLRAEAGGGSFLLCRSRNGLREFFLFRTAAGRGSFRSIP
ncbi:uncharacterized protein LOC129752790 [Uranotaenia lowii]|uniref:uncharacterized protein LOC129752790 n=1 Tax=Uranotaenia lowii TaxID=190385 RepID=UPI002479AEB6|nr:uncharacterized protein LOC129752790 [Uranotaenia lowii]